MTLTKDQEAALSSIKDFCGSQEGTAFLLEGGAGVGKTFLLGEILKGANTSPLCVAAPTHKAINVLRRKLDAFGVPWTLGYDAYTYDGSSVITGTTAQLLGIRPVITDDQGTEVKFGKTGQGILSKIMPTVLVIDEVSMLGKIDFMALRETLKSAGSKLLAVGDAGQLPPVKQEAVPFDKFKHRAGLREIVRQAKDSSIVTLAWAIRDGKEWHNIEGGGVRRVERLGEAFIEQLGANVCFTEEPGKGKTWLREEDRPVFIAYTNKRVNTVQEHATQKLYGHGRLAFAPGELVLSETNLYRGKVLMCANQDELIVDSFMEDMRDPVCGVPVVIHHHSDPRKGKFTAHYLSPEELKDAAHPYNVELEKRRSEAVRLQEEMKRASGYAKDDINTRRRRAWMQFFDWKDQTVISFRHPFAITSHKSQGSTYKSVFADVADLGRFSVHALYVAVTRPREELILTRV
jgi:exodeoxyribonuclease-5